ncbi:MAG: phosphotransferase family protein [Candidatus Rokuibacteriota bacterium]
MTPALRAILGAGARRVRRWRGRDAPVEGLPDGLARETVEEVCRRQLGAGLERVAYEHLSGWKSTGSYRVWLHSARGHRASVVYRNALYGVDQIPALARLPVKPGPAEYVVYTTAAADLRGYLPDAYLVKEVVPGRHYQYVLEDLGSEYDDVRMEAAPDVAEALGDIRRAMQEWLSRIDPGRLLRYDHRFSEDLQVYVFESLTRYVNTASNETVAELLRRWDAIAAVHRDRAFHAERPLEPIHGDFNRSNILMHRHRKERLKIIDWEWCGLGTAHADIASLLKNATPEVERRVMAIAAAADPRLTPEEHGRLYAWCRLERGLLDAAFLAVQELSDGARSMRGHIDAAARRALGAYRELSDRHV